MGSLNLTIVKKISIEILSTPLTQTVGLDYFVPQIAKLFRKIPEHEIDELLTDICSEYHDSLCGQLEKAGQVLNFAEHRKGEIVICPTSKSANLANNDADIFVKEMIEYLDGLSDYEKGVKFEHTIKYLLEVCSLDPKTTPSTGDFGLDLICKSNHIEPFNASVTYYIQCKYYDGSIDVNVIKKLIADSMFQIMDGNSGITHPILPILISKNRQSKSATDLAKLYGVHLYDFKSIVNMVAMYGKIPVQSIKDLLLKKGLKTPTHARIS